MRGRLQSVRTEAPMKHVLAGRERERARESETFTTRHAYNRHKVHEYPSLSKNREVYLRLTMEHFKPDCRTSARGSVCKTWGASLKIVNEKNGAKPLFWVIFFCIPRMCTLLFCESSPKKKKKRKRRSLPADRLQPSKFSRHQKRGELTPLFMQSGATYHT